MCLARPHANLSLTRFPFHEGVGLRRLAEATHRAAHKHRCGHRALAVARARREFHPMRVA